MKDELFCDAVRDLLPSYAEGLTSPVTTVAIENHVVQCEQCRRLLHSISDSSGQVVRAKEIDYLKAIRSRNRRKVGIGILATVLITAATLFLWMQVNAVSNIVDIVYSGDRSRALVIYDRDISGISESQNAFFVKQYNNLDDSALTDLQLRWFGSFITDNTLNIVYEGPYRSSLWSPDGSMFIVNGGEGVITLDCLEGNHSPNIHLFVAGLLGGAVRDQLGYNIGEDSSGYEGVMLTALQWSDDSQRVLINYVVADTEANRHSGYVWYDCVKNTMSGLVENGYDSDL